MTSAPIARTKSVSKRWRIAAYSFLADATTTTIAVEQLLFADLLHRMLDAFEELKAARVTELRKTTRCKGLLCCEVNTTPFV